MPIPSVENDAASTTTPAVLKNLRTIYREAHAKIEATRAANLKALTDPLTARLRTLESDLAKKDRIADAQTVKEYREGLGSESAPALDADGDGQSNEHEFLAGTSPLNGGSHFALRPGVSGTNIEFSFTLPPNRSFQLESSSDLLNWRLWDAPGNNGMPMPGGPVLFSAPAATGPRFFRLLWREE